MPRSVRPKRVLPIALRDVTVLGVSDVTPNVRRLTLGGPELAGGPRDDWGLGFHAATATVGDAAP